MLDILMYDKRLSGKGLLSVNVPHSSTLLNLVFSRIFPSNFWAQIFTLLSNKNRLSSPYTFYKSYFIPTTSSKSFPWVTNSTFTSIIKPFSNSLVTTTFFLLQLYFGLVLYLFVLKNILFLRYNLPIEKCSNFKFTVPWVLTSAYKSRCMHFYSYRTFSSLLNVVFELLPSKSPKSLSGESVLIYITIL